MLSYLNQPLMYLITASILGFISVVALVFMIKSYKAGVKMGMDKVVLKKAITSSLTFTVLPSVSILLGILALGGALGVPFSWLRLSVIGSLQYELNVAEIASRAMGMSGLRVAEMTPAAFTTIGLIMTAGISAGGLACIFFLKRYFTKLRSKTQKGKEAGKASMVGVLVVAMFIGLCAAYIGSYIGLFVTSGYFLPLLTAGIAGVFMLLFDFLIHKKGIGWLENFSVAGSMLIAMAGVVVVNYLLS